MSKKNAGLEVQRIIDRENLERTLVGLHLRQTVALETIARCLARTNDYLDRIVDANDGSLRMKDIERAKVYSTHLGKKLKQ